MPPFKKTLETTLACRAYPAGFVLMLLTCLFLLWAALGVGINGPDGEPFDRVYLVVFAVGLGGALVGRFRPQGMAKTLAAMAAAQVCVALLALALGKHLSGVSPAIEILAVNGLFVGLFLAAAWLFRLASIQRGRGESSDKSAVLQ